MSKRHEDTTSTTKTASRRIGRALTVGLLLAGLVAMLPGVATASPEFKIGIVNLSSPVAVGGQEYTLRTNVVTTCQPLMSGGFGTCDTIELTVAWWTDSSSVKVGERRVLMLGGPLTFSIPAADVHAPRLYYKITASQVWNLRTCLIQAPCDKQKTAAAQVSGSANVM